MKVLEKVKISVDHLKAGMYVCELDIPWDDSPYILHGFMLHGESDIRRIRKICDYVYVDTKSLESAHKAQKPANNDVQADFDSQHSGKYQVIDVNLPKEAKKILGKGGSIVNLPLPRVTTGFQEELTQAREIYGRLYKETTRVFLAVDHDETPVIQPLTSLVLEVIASINRNPSAFEWIVLTNPNDKSVKQHCINVCILSLKFGHHIGLPDRINRLLGLAGLVFDLGKTLMSDAIMQKTTSLTPTEMKVMQKHSEIGASIIDATGDVAPEILNVCLKHHERMDGSGYPNQLRGTDVDLLSRMVAIIDTYDAIITAKYYAERSSTNQAMDELYKSREKGYDKELVEAFIRMNGLYPVGTAIETNSGEIGLVVSNNEKSKLSPSVLMVLNKEKQPYSEENIIDFATTLNDSGQPRYTIKQAVNANYFDINPKDCFRNT
jgi:HD-GYP domain-containing protein (c-di-GMP phosphodiesterase class II)